MGFDKTKLQQIAMWIKQTNNGMDVALANQKNAATVYYSLHDPTKANYPTSAIVELIQALNQHDTPGYQDKVLRDTPWVYHTAVANTMDEQMAKMNNIKLEKLTAKKLSEDYAPPKEGKYVPATSRRWEDGSPLDAFQEVGAGPVPTVAFGGGKEAGTHTVDRLYMMAVYALVTRRFIKNKDHASANIGALLVSKVGKILAWAVNTKENNSTCHAEVNVLQSVFRSSPNVDLNGARLYTTLKPCAMCAGMIAHVGQGNIQVLYGQGDFGPQAAKTVLDGTGKLHALDGGNKDAKAVMAIVKANQSEGKANLLRALEDHRNEHKGGLIADALALDGATTLMRGAVRAMELKVKKYQDSSGGNANVRAVLEHIGPFLLRNSAHPTQIAELTQTVELL